MPSSPECEGAGSERRLSRGWCGRRLESLLSMGGAGAGSERLLSRGVDCRRMYGRPSVHVGRIFVVLQRRGLLRGCGGCEGGDAFTPFGGNRGGEEITTAAVAAGRQSTKSLCIAKKGCFPGGSADAVGGGEEALVAAHASVGEESEDEGEDEESDAAEEDGSGVVVGSG